MPSTAAALGLAAALACRVEDLFRLAGTTVSGAESLAWLPRRDPCRYWKADIHGRIFRYPTEASPVGVTPHDGVFKAGDFIESERVDVSQRLVIATCDPAIGLLGLEIE